MFKGVATNSNNSIVDNTLAKYPAISHLTPNISTKIFGEKINTKMDSGNEYWYTLKEKIPVYIGYFTAWVDTEGVIHFYEDVYQRDEKLAALLFENREDLKASE